MLGTHYPAQYGDDPPTVPATGASVGSLFMGGITPGVILGTLMILVTIFYGIKNKIPRTKFSLRDFLSASYHAIGAIFMPVIILGGIYSGILPPPNPPPWPASTALWWAFSSTGR